MISINILCVGKLKENYLRDALGDYSKRLSKYCKLNIIEIPDEKIPDNASVLEENQVKEKEANKILEKIEKNTYVIALDLKGKEYTSPEFAEKISSLAINGVSSITFIIGGSLGIGESVLKVSKEKICFSKMTFPHGLFRIFLLEQIYRGFKILNNETYHK